MTWINAHWWPKTYSPCRYPEACGRCVHPVRAKAAAVEEPVNVTARKASTDMPDLTPEE